MSSLASLKEKTVRSLSSALIALNEMPDGTNGRDSAIRTLNKTRQRVSSVNLPGYIAIRKSGGNAGPVFFDPINESIKDISGNSILNVPHDLTNILRQQSVSQPDVNVLNRVAAVTKNLKAARRSLRLMRSSWLRFLMGPWVIVGIFAFAIIYAVIYFIFRGSEVAAPLTPDGAKMVVEKASTSVAILKSTLNSNSSGDILDAISKFVEKLTHLISTLPALIAAFGVLYSACRKLVIQ
jgi:hypothetical protein